MTLIPFHVVNSNILENRSLKVSQLLEPRMLLGAHSLTRNICQILVLITLFSMYDLTSVLLL